MCMIVDLDKDEFRWPSLLCDPLVNLGQGKMCQSDACGRADQSDMHTCKEQFWVVAQSVVLARYATAPAFFHVDIYLQCLAVDRH